MIAPDEVTTLRAELARAHATIAMLREALTEAQARWQAMQDAKAALSGGAHHGDEGRALSGPENGLFTNRSKTGVQ